MQLFNNCGHDLYKANFFELGSGTRQMSTFDYKREGGVLKVQSLVYVVYEWPKGIVVETHANGIERTFIRTLREVLSNTFIYHNA